MYSQSISKVVIHNGDQSLLVGKMPYTVDLKTEEIKTIQQDYSLQLKQKEQIKQNVKFRQNNPNQLLQIPKSRRSQKEETYVMTNLKDNVTYQGQLTESDNQSRFICLYLNKDQNGQIQANIIGIRDFIKFDRTINLDDETLDKIDQVMKNDMKGFQQIREDDVYKPF